MRVGIGLATGLLLASVALAQGPNRTPGGIAWEATGSGPAVVLITGANLDRRMWDDQMAALASRFRVIRYDIRAHGASADVTGPFSMIDDLAEVMDAAGAPRAHLVGLSLGSRIALDFALAHPERVDRLVLAGPWPSGAVSTERAPWMDSMMAALRARDIDRAVVVVAESPVFAVPPARAAWMREMVIANGRLFRQDPRAERPLQPPALGRLAEVKTPTLVVVGDRDARDIQRVADSLARGISGARKVVVPGAAHIVNVWAPELFNRAVVAFLSNP
ncbi:MAG: alpha/beta fold hydrolase [Gemmatimonadales bacterium]